MAGERQYEQNHTDLVQLLGNEDHRRIKVDGYMDLVIEKLEGSPIVSLCHYGEQNGDLMRDPEVCFHDTGMEAKPIYFRNDYAGVEHATMPEHFGDVPIRPHLQTGLDSFVRLWFENLRDQGFFKKAAELDQAARVEEQPAPLKGNVPTSTETAMSETETQRADNHQELATIIYGRFSANLYGRYNEASETWTYRADLHCNGRQVFAPMLKHDLAGVLRMTAERGQEWLSDTLKACKVPDPTATVHDVLEFEKVLHAGEMIIGRFAKMGHEFVLRHKAVSPELVVEVEDQRSPHEDDHCFTRER